ncbi:unnamed protein product [Diamesa serratosioi]
MLKLTIFAIYLAGIVLGDHGGNHSCMRGHEAKDPSECCEMPEVIDSAIVEKCKGAFPKPRGPPPFGDPSPGVPRGCCMTECILNSTGILVNGKVDKIVAQKVMAKNLQGDAAWVLIINNAIDKCQIDAVAKEADMKITAAMVVPAGDLVCHPISGFLIGCVTGQIYKNCPANKYKAGEECDKIKTFSYAMKSEICYAGTGSLKRPENCCNLPTLIDPAIVSKCKADNPKTNGHHSGHQKGCCMAECLLNTTGIYSNRVLNKAVAQKVLSQYNPAWSQVINNAIDKCLADAGTRDAEFTANTVVSSGDLMCNPLSGFFVSCVNGQVFKNCPTDQKINFDDECIKLSTYADNCGIKLGKGK